MRMVVFTLVTAAGVAGILGALTYPAYRRQMETARVRVAAGALHLHTRSGDIEYGVEGEGPPVLSLHGAGGGYDQGLWAARMAFGEGYRFIAVSRFGYLGSPVPRDASIHMQAAICRELLDHLGLQRVVVLGSSAGGPSAMQFANDYPERTSALLLLSAVSQPAAPGDKAPFYVHAIHLIQRSDYAYWLATRCLQPVMLSLMGVPSGVYARLTPPQKQLAQAMLDTMHPMSERYRGTINDGEMIRRGGVSTSKVSAPTLVLHAKDDALVSYRHAEHAHDVIQGSRLKLYETGGHGLLPQMNSVRQEVSALLQSGLH